ncbi:MAG TPA: hypothetical protein VMT50_02660 [Steroidobacteraceae bacterium]|nr:hypothetical protein [Steroidobacteraceae bacterium]
MFVGHYAPACLVKAAKPEIPLGFLFLAAQLIDVAWAILVLGGVEKVRIVPGFTASNALDLYYMPYTHSLVAAVLWAVSALVVYRFVPQVRPWVLAGLLGLTVLSHWVLDLLVHVPDLPLYANSHKLGLGLWNYPIFENTLEVIILLGSMLAMVKMQPGADGSTLRKALSLCIVLTLAQLYMALGPLPASAFVLATSSLACYAAFCALAWMFDRRAVPAGGAD